MLFAQILAVMSSEDYETGLATPQEGWSTHLPTFANQTNKELDVYIKRVQRELEYTDVSLEDNEDRIRVMAEHLANVQGELKYIQSRCNAKNNEIQTEGHLRQLSKRQGVRLLLHADMQSLVSPSLLFSDALGSIAWNEVFVPAKQCYTELHPTYLSAL